MDFLVFAPNPWHDIWRNRQQIFSRLAGPNRVLYVEPGRTSLSDWRRGRVAWADLRRPAVMQEQPGLWLYRIPTWLPARGTGDAFDRTSDRLLAWHLRRVMQRLGFNLTGPRPAPGVIAPKQLPAYADTSGPATSAILWLYRPTRWRWAATSFPHHLLVYHVTDDYTVFGHLTDAQRAALAESERELLAAADLTIVTAPRLVALKQPYARRIELVPNGVDYQAFQRARLEPRALAPLLDLPRPILGYSGHISNRLDLPLLRGLALARPGWTFALAGSRDPRGCQAELAGLEDLPNVHFLGLLPVEDVPHFIIACDVCLIPYRVNDETRAISSLKLYEYLAAGKPVVSAAAPAAEEHRDVVQIAEAGVKSWLAQVEGALATADDQALIARRQAVAAANTWEDRVRRIEEILAARQTQ